MTSEYNWQQDDWPQFEYCLEELIGPLEIYSSQLERLRGQLEMMSPDTSADLGITSLLEEALKTSAIEGEVLSRRDVMSSIRKNLGLDNDKPAVRDPRVNGITALLVEVRKNYSQAMTSAELCHWHQLLMTGNTHIRAGQWRSHPDPMQVVSGAIGKEIIHFVAPPSSSVVGLMSQFITWFNESAPTGEAPIKFGPVRSAIAHLYFETIHPFEDGNGRIGRAISEKVLFQDASMALPISLSQSIAAERSDYYEALQRAQRSNVITEWLGYFIQMLLRAHEQAREQVLFVIARTHFFDRHKSALNPRQEKVIAKMMAQGASGFAGGMNAKKYMRISKTSKATATRDLSDLVNKGIFVKNPGGGRNTSYALKLDSKAQAHQTRQDDAFRKRR